MKAAIQGTEALKSWRDSLTDAERDDVKSLKIVAKLTKAAKEADEKNKPVEDDLF